MSELGALGISGGDYRGGNFFGNSSNSDGEKIFRDGLNDLDCNGIDDCLTKVQSKCQSNTVTLGNSTNVKCHKRCRLRE